MEKDGLVLIIRDVHRLPTADILSDVTFFSAFTALSTLASIIQQLHYATAWVVIKQAEFDKAVEDLEHPALAVGGAAQVVDKGLFLIREYAQTRCFRFVATNVRITEFYCYNVMSLNVMFWYVRKHRSAQSVTHSLM